VTGGEHEVVSLIPSRKVVLVNDGTTMKKSKSKREACVVMGNQGLDEGIRRMKRGLVYVVSPTKEFLATCGKRRVTYNKLDATESDLVKDMVEEHCHETGSRKANELLSSWAIVYRHKVVRVKAEEFLRPGAYWRY